MAALIVIVFVQRLIFLSSTLFLVLRSIHLTLLSEMLDVRRSSTGTVSTQNCCCNSFAFAIGIG